MFRVRVSSILAKRVSPSSASVAGRWPFPLPPWPCSVTEAGLRGFHRRRSSIARVRPSSPSRPFRANPVARTSRSSPSSLEIVLFPPLRRHALQRPLPMTSPSPSVDELPGSPIPFRPRGFAPPRRLAPLSRRGLVASRCRPWGSPRFPSHAPRPPKPPGARGPFPATPPTPRRTPLARSRFVFPRSLPPRRYSRLIQRPVARTSSTEVEGETRSHPRMRRPHFSDPSPSRVT